MDALVNAAESVLRRHAAPALRLTELLQLVRAETGIGTLDALRLRSTLETHPDRFRLLDPWRGPWRFIRRVSDAHTPAEPWVVVVGDPGDQGAPEPASRDVEQRLRASVRWLGLTLDAGSSRAVARWHAMVLEESGARASLRRKAA